MMSKKQLPCFPQKKKKKKVICGAQRNENVAWPIKKRKSEELPL